ncbi:hypothetical protein DR864_05805 [Runella rosea]|uniref:Uncharacterized protein n=1 Tax=Runella rosea TaxID=2259595 RepID=A0A344TF60_9BACT|nr:hypothetical protein [Runella rosea]AXE17281.1 hypothetical protein DR864_05805 [Runella rosea]
MKDDDELKELLGGMFKDFESEPNPQAWQRIEAGLLTAPRNAVWPRIILGALIGVFCAGICHAPVHSKWLQATAKINIDASANQPVKMRRQVQFVDKQLVKTVKVTVNELATALASEKISSAKTLIEPQKEQNSPSPALTEPEKTTLAAAAIPPSFQPELLKGNGIKAPTVILGSSQVNVLQSPVKSTSAIRLWSISVMPLATYQRMYVLPEATAQIQQIHSEHPLNGSRTGLRIGTELTLLHDRSAWRVGLSYTQMRQRMQYTLSTNEYKLSTLTPQPTVSWQTEQAEEMSEWHLVGIRADRQYQLAANGRQRYFVSLGTEAAIEMDRRQPYVWGHISVGMQKLLTPRVWMTVEPTASYSVLSKTTANGLLRVNPYNFGLKVSLGMMP